MWLSLLTNRRVIITTIVVFITSLFFSSPAFAQTTSIAIWPPLLEATIQPGKSITQVYRLKNLGDDTTITAYLKPFSPADELGHVKLQDSKPPSTNFFSLLNANLDTLPVTFPLKAGQTQELVLKVKIPNDFSPSDHYFTFLFDSQTTGLIGNSGTTTQASLGSNILLTISDDGQPKHSAKIEEFTVLQGKKTLSGSELPVKVPNLHVLDSFSPISFLLRVKNTGNSRFKAIGQIELKNIFNKPIATLPIRQDNILANSTRKLQTTTNWSPVFPLGRYTATATITPQDSTNSLTQPIYFIVLPYKALLVILLFYAGLKSLTKLRK